MQNYEIHVCTILHFTVVCLVNKPLNRSEARVDFVDTNLAAPLVIMLTTCSFASLLFQGHPHPRFHTKAQITFHRTVKCSILISYELTSFGAMFTYYLFNI